MKYVQMFSLIFCLLISCSSIFAAEGVIQQFDKGYVNWSDMTITSIGKGEFDANLSPAQYRLSAVRNARKDAEKKFLSILLQLNYSATKSVRDILLESVEATNRIEKYIEDYKFIGKPRLMPDSSVELTVELSLTGNILNELLALSIKSEAVEGQEALPAELTPSYSGLIIDCRGLEIEYALAPRVITSDNREIYSAAQVDLNVAIETGLIGYYTDEKTAQARVGETSLLIRAVRISGINSCDAVIDKNQAAQFMLEGEFRGILKNCRVVFLVD